MTRILLILALIAAGLTPQAAGAATPRPKPVTVAAQSSCEGYIWVITATVTSTTDRVVDVVTDNDYGLQIAGTLRLTHNVVSSLQFQPGSYGQMTRILITPTGRPDADPLASTVVFDPIQLSPAALC
jgi:hypothetical protein